MLPPDVRSDLEQILLASVLAAPEQPGLSRAEMSEVAGRIGLLPGEVRDGLRGRLEPLLPDKTRVETALVWWTEPDDLRSIEAFDFLYREVNHAIRSLGAGAAAIPAETVITRGLAEGIVEHDLRVAIAVHVLTEKLVEESGVLRPKQPGYFHRVPSETLRHNTRQSRTREKWSPRFREILAATQDVVTRRTDGRPPAADPLDAFASVLPSLGHDGYEVWWRQMVAEHRRLNPAATPTAYTVLAAALSEAALVFVCAEARQRGLPLVPDTVFAKGPKEWSVDLLIRGAKKTKNPMFDDATGRRAERLKAIRQRIHAGRYLAQHATPGQLDLRPEEALEAGESARVIVRAVLDWLERTAP